ncbi:MAG: CinA family protein [bacterium]|nr:CinA family protein [bacterium]
MDTLTATITQIISLLEEKQQTLATAESCTGGMIGEYITNIPGASSIYLGGIIAYHNTIKKQLLNVPDSVLQEHGAVSELTAFYMAKGAQQILKSTWVISVTGIAGPDGGSINKPVGTICLGLAGPHKIITKTLVFKNQNRQDNRESACNAALNWLLTELLS